MGRGGYIKIHRKMFENPTVMKDADHLAVWIYLLGEAEWKPTPDYFMGEKITLQPGQFTIGRKQIAEALRVTESKVQRILKCYADEQLIEQQTSNRNRLITIVKWDKYQVDEQQSEQQMNNQRTTDEQQMNTPEETKKPRNQKSNRAFKPPTLEEIKAYCLERKNNVDPETFYDFYESKGWMVGKNKMKDWQSAVRNWERREAGRPQTTSKTPEPPKYPEFPPEEKREGVQMPDEIRKKINEMY